MFRSGYVGIIGRPNVGKSTLLNRLLGMKIAIVTPVPQTTRKKITGILNLPDAQIVLMDTPGVHRAKGAFNREMVRVASGAMKDADVVWMMTTACEACDRVAPEIRGEEEDLVLDMVGKTGASSILVINKTDVTDKPAILPFIEEMRSRHDFDEFIPISALTGDGVDVLVRETARRLPEGPRYYDEGAFTDQMERDLAAEIVREKAMLATREEVPHSIAVTVEQWMEPREEGGTTRIEATVHVERNSQKAILIGRRGEMLKRIGTGARLEIERMLSRKVYLGLFVRVEKDWRRSEPALRKLGFV